MINIIDNPKTTRNTQIGPPAAFVNSRYRLVFGFLNAPNSKTVPRSSCVNCTLVFGGATTSFGNTPAKVAPLDDAAADIDCSCGSAEFLKTGITYSSSK